MQVFLSNLTSQFIWYYEFVYKTPYDVSVISISPY